MEMEDANIIKNSYLPKYVYVYWKILGLCPFSIAGNEIIYYTKSGMFYGAFLALTYSTFYLKLVIDSDFKFYYLPTDTMMTMIADFAGLFIEFALIVSSWVHFSFSQKKLQKIVKVCKVIITEMKLIGIEQNYARNFRRLTIQIFIINLLWLALYICDQILVCFHNKVKCTVWMSFSMLRITNHNIILMFIYALLSLEKYFSLLNKKISNLPQEVVPIPLDSHIIDRLSVKQSRLVTRVTLTSLETYGQLHSDLITLTKLIVEFFTLPIILSLLSHIILMACDLYFLCILIKAEEFDGIEAKYTLIVMFSWLFFHTVETVVILAIPDSLVNEANRTGTVLHDMLTSNQTQKYTSTGPLVSLRLLQEHLTITAWGLFELKFSVMHTMISTICAYVTIMMQLDDFKLQRTITE